MTSVTDHDIVAGAPIGMTKQANRLGMANMWVGFGAFALAIPMGLYQVAERSDLFPAVESASLYYTSVTTHGVLMAYVLTTFFIMGYGYHSAINSLKMPLPSSAFSWIGFWIALIGTALAAWTLLTGQASVMYTFYPPEMGHTLFYIGVAGLVIGSWFWCIDMIWMMGRWKRANPGMAVPLVMFGTTINALLWLWTSMGATLEIVTQILPLKLGLVDGIEAGLARTLFSWTLHAIVYFWLIPAYIAFYTLMPQQAKAKLFSDEFARIAFVMLFIFSVPIGFHHLYMDPQQAAGWKLLHMFGTYMVAVPTLITGFTVMATLELSGKLRGGRGLLGWIPRMPWRNPVVLASILSMMMLTFGGFGGVINASYALNALVHDTQWVTGHFHLIFGGTSVIMYFAVAYWAWPRMTGRALFSRKLALWQLWLWAIGMVVTTGPWHVLGLQGQPRRVNTLPYGEELNALWTPYEAIMLSGSVILTLSAILFIVILVGTHMTTRKAETTEVVYATAIHQPLKVPNLLNSLSFWNWAMLAYMLASYGYPIVQFLFIESPLAVPYGY
ncbi:cbb3-type cytochrome c oxidase subunit I [Mesobacterium sp. TK19101]|uniref:Cbb3-type cytochrome c oxidase subunit I n=1 Tax=Mesobacterium hydrothermale TaxID=3111907 RepID=A0ABU6HLS6_9RHOB|nr:cbb3-type cytochrome c oxidase subunit I [Mesobacterium sp. TK19101]MEC3863399.1 cbb3-type cytochrome c oxidase subunit I [Mesobacterium sp. TK19101]